MWAAKRRFRTMVVLAASLAAGTSFLFSGPARGQSQIPAKPHPTTQAGTEEVGNPRRMDRFGDPFPKGALFRFGSVRMRHAGQIFNSALSPDGTLLATASRGVVLLWNLADGKIVRRFDCEGSTTFCTPGLCFSPNGEYLGYVQDSYDAYLWNVQSGKEVMRFSEESGYTGALCRFTGDNRELIRDDGSKRIRFWNLEARKESRFLSLERISLLSPDACWCVHIEPKKGLAFFDSTTGKKIGRLDVSAVYSGIENGIAFSPDCKWLAVVHDNKEIQVYSFPGCKRRSAFPMPDSARYRVNLGDHWEYRLAFSGDGKTLLLGTKAGLVHRWDLASEKELPPLDRHLGPVAGMHTLPDGQTIITTGADGLIRRWDRRTGRQLAEPPGYAGRIHAAYAPDGRFAAVGDGRGRLELWDARSGRSLRVLQQEGPAVTKVAFAPNGKCVAAALTDRTIHFLAVPSGQEQHVLRCGKEQKHDHLWDMRFSPDDRRLVIADGGYHLRCWDIAGEKVLWGGARSGRLAFAADGQTVLTAYAGPYVSLLDAATGKLRHTLRVTNDIPENSGGISSVALSPDGSRVVVGAYSGTVYLNDARTGAEVAHFQAVDAPKGTHLPPGIKRRGLNVDGLQFSPDGRYLCTCGSDGSVRLWEVATSRQVLKWDAHEGRATEIGFGSDNRTVLSCGEDAQAYLWSLRPPLEREAKRSLDSLWTTLAGEPAAAYRAIWAMSETKDTAAFLRNKLVPVKPVPNERLRRLVADLESDTFTVREQATKSLSELGRLATPVLRQALASKPPLETRKRVELLLQRIEEIRLSTDELRMVRAIDALGHQGTAEARKLLHDLASGAPGALPTTEAQTALKQLPR